MKKKIEWEEYKSSYIKKKITVDFPVYFVDEYGYYSYSADGKTTIEIGLNGVQCCVKTSHSIKTATYFSGERYLKRKKDLSLNEWREALKKVGDQIVNLINKTL